MFRGERLVFKDISVVVPPGGALLLRGPNGSGKSSLLRALAGLTPLAAGDIKWGAENALEDLPTHAKRIAWLGHLDAVKLPLLVGEQVTDQDALGAVGLAGYRDLPAKLLSAGQKRRLALARIIAAKRPLWLLDEPTNGLDSASISLLTPAFATHRAANGIVIASTHTELTLPNAELLQL